MNEDSIRLIDENQCQAPLMSQNEEPCGSSSYHISMQLKLEQRERQKLQEKQSNTEKELDYVKNQVKVMHKLLAS